MTSFELETRLLDRTKELGQMYRVHVACQKHCLSTLDVVEELTIHIAKLTGTISEIGTQDFLAGVERERQRLRLDIHEDILRSEQLQQNTDELFRQICRKDHQGSMF